MKNSKSAIEIENLTKAFDGLVAVDHISLNVEEGQIFGFLGPNGAGKTTAIKMLCTILNPSSGSARVCGYDIGRQRAQVRRCIGIVFQDPSVDRFLTGKENLDFHARMYQMDGKSRERRIAEVLDLLDLQGREHIRIEHCSGGIQRRFEVARGFLHRPRVLFLDEPTLGLDVQTRRNLWNYIKLLNKQEGTAIIVTTHYMEEADYLCHRMAIIDRGKIVANGTPEELKQAVGLNLITLRVDEQSSSRMASLLRQIDWIEKIEERDGLLELSVDRGEERVPELVDFADSHSCTISSVKLRKPSLEDTFLHYTGKTIREEEGNSMDLFRAWVRKSRIRR